jgi:hypothetical protein
MNAASNPKPATAVTAGHGSPYLRTADAAAYLGLGKSTLERLRWAGGGPKFRILGAKVIPTPSPISTLGHRSASASARARLRDP